MTRTHRPDTLAQALELRARLGASLYAGGTDLMPRGRRWMGLRPALPDEVIFVGHLDELRGLGVEGGRLAIGSCRTLAELMREEQTPALLRKVIGSMAAPGVRTLATLGGNICNASPAGDTLPYLYAMDAVLLLQGPNGQREVGMADFIIGPGHTDLGKDEILTRVSIPLHEFNREDHQKIAARKANALSKASFLGLAKAEGGKLLDLRLALGAVAPTVVRSRELELRLLEAANGNGRDPALLAEVLEGYAGLVDPIDDQRSSAAYRKHVALGLVEEFLAAL